jgi:hypothetical protein
MNGVAKLVDVGRIIRTLSSWLSEIGFLLRQAEASVNLWTRQFRDTRAKFKLGDPRR